VSRHTATERCRFTTNSTEHPDVAAAVDGSAVDHSTVVSWPIRVTKIEGTSLSPTFSNYQRCSSRDVARASAKCGSRQDYSGPAALLMVDRYRFILTFGPVIGASLAAVQRLAGMLPAHRCCVQNALLGRETIEQPIAAGAAQIALTAAAIGSPRGMR
jgi:hypothetical protein